MIVMIVIVWVVIVPVAVVGGLYLASRRLSGRGIAREPVDVGELADEFVDQVARARARRSQDEWPASATDRAG